MRYIPRLLNIIFKNGGWIYRCIVGVRGKLSMAMSVKTLTSCLQIVRSYMKISVFGRYRSDGSWLRFTVEQPGWLQMTNIASLQDAGPTIKYRFHPKRC